jgi:hypothetical protein
MELTQFRKSQSPTSSISDHKQRIDEEKTNINYKTKWEATEFEYHQLWYY